jgi:hypothetical protein
VSTFTSRVFGGVPIEVPGDGSWRGTIILNGKPTPTRLYLDDHLSSSPQLLQPAAQLLDQLDQLDLLARDAIRDELTRNPEGGVVAGYMEMHFEELDEAFTQSVFGRPREDVTTEVWLSALVFDKAAVHVDAPSGFSIVLDYVLDATQSDQLLAVTFGMDGRVLRVAHES